MEDVAVLALILALALGLVSLAMVARLPERKPAPGVSWLPPTLLLYNLWVAGFLAAGYVQDHAPAWAPPHLMPALVETSKLVLLALALAWLYAHIAQLRSFLGMVPPLGGARVPRRMRVTFAAVGVAGGVLLIWVGYAAVVRPLASVLAFAVFPAALIASVWFVLRARRLDDAAWRTRLLGLGTAYVGLFACLFGLSMAWSRLAAVSPGLPVALDAALELLYNVVAIVWVTRLIAWLRRTTTIPLPHVAPHSAERARLLAAHGITRREEEIIGLICLGKTNREIADALFISLATVKDHNYVIFQKLAVRNRTELARLVLSGVQGQLK